MKTLWRTALSILFFLLLMPLLIVVLWTVAKNWPWPMLWPEAVGLRGIEYLMDPVSKTASVLWCSVGLSLVVMFITLAVSVPAAKALGCREFKGKRAIYIFMLMPILVPPLTVAMGIHVAFIRMGLANTFLGVVIIHLICGIPYAVRILTHVFELIGERMETQARILGATRWQTLMYVTLPIIAPGLVSAGSMVFIVSFSQYFLTFFIGGGRVVTFPMVMFPYIQSGDRMMASVYSVSFITVALLVLFILEGVMKRIYKNTDNHYLSDL